MRDIYKGKAGHLRIDRDERIVKNHAPNDQRRYNEHCL
jgi:hypothetical protein